MKMNKQQIKMKLTKQQIKKLKEENSGYKNLDDKDIQRCENAKRLLKSMKGGD